MILQGLSPTNPAVRSLSRTSSCGLAWYKLSSSLGCQYFCLINYCQYHLTNSECYVFSYLDKPMRIHPSFTNGLKMWPKEGNAKGANILPFMLTYIVTGIFFLSCGSKLLMSFHFSMNSPIFSFLVRRVYQQYICLLIWKCFHFLFLFFSLR